MTSLSVHEAVGRGVEAVFGDLETGWKVLWDCEVVSTVYPCHDGDCEDAEPIEDENEETMMAHTSHGVLVRIILMDSERARHRMDFLMDVVAVAQDRVAEAFVRVRTEAAFAEQASSLSDVAAVMQRIVQESQG